MGLKQGGRVDIQGEAEAGAGRGGADLAQVLEQAHQRRPAAAFNQDLPAKPALEAGEARRSRPRIRTRERRS